MSWGRSIGTRIYIAGLALAGVVCLAWSFAHWHSSDPREVRLLSDRGAAGIIAEGDPAGHRRNAVGQLPVHAAGNSGTESARNPADRAGLHVGPGLLETGAAGEAGASALQLVAVDGLERDRVRRLPVGRKPYSAWPRAAGSSGRRHHALRLQYGGDVHHHRPDRREADPEGVERHTISGHSLTTWSARPRRDWCIS